MRENSHDGERFVVDFRVGIVVGNTVRWIQLVAHLDVQRTRDLRADDCFEKAVLFRVALEVSSFFDLVFFASAEMTVS